MRSSKKDRRSERVDATQRLLLTIMAPSGAELLKEIITTVEISQHGTRIRGRRKLSANWLGNLVQLTSGRQAPIRVVWQGKSGETEYLDAGLELLAEHNFWERAFANPDAPPPEALLENPGLSPEELVRELTKSGLFNAQDSGQMLEGIWCGLVEQLEERQVFTRAELVASIKKMADHLRGSKS